MIGFVFMATAFVTLFGAMLILYVQNLDLREKNRELAKKVPKAGWTKRFDLGVTRIKEEVRERS